MRRSVLASAFLGAVLILVSAAALAGEVPDVAGPTAPEATTPDAPDTPSTDPAVDPSAADPLPDEGSVKVRVGDRSQEVGVDDGDVDEDLPAADAVSVDEDRLRVTAGGPGGTETVTVEAPAAVAGAWSVPDEVSHEVGFSTDAGTGLLLFIPLTDSTDTRFETPRSDDYMASTALGFVFWDYDDDSGRYGSDSKPLRGLDSIRPYRMTSVPRTTEAVAPGGGPSAVRPASGPGPAVGPSEGSQGEAEAATSTRGGFGGVLDVSDRTAAAAAAVTAIPALAYVLYHRIKGHEVLDNETRKAIYDEVCREPGLGVDELSDVADVSYSTASYHLNRLEEADMVVSSKRGKKICFFQNGGTFDEDERELLKVLRNEEAMRVFVDIMDHPGTYRARIADRLDVSTTTVNWHLDALVEAGLVREHRDGRTAHLYVAQDRVDDHVRPLLDKTHDEDVDAPASVTRLRSRLQPAAKA